MPGFVNKRIEMPFADSFRGINQYVYTGCTDDLFLMGGDRNTRKLCSITEAFVEYGRRSGYDIIITVNEDLTLTFDNSEQETLFHAIADRSSERLVDQGHRAQVQTFVPREGRNQRVRRENPQAGAAAVQTPPTRVARAEEEARRRTEGREGLNRLERITRALKCADKKILVIFPYPEKLLDGGRADGDALQKLNVVFREWRAIIPEAHSVTRTVLIVNPHRLEEVRRSEHYVSDLDHTFREVVIPPPPVEEMREWLVKYRMENNIGGTPHDEERVVLTGKANAGGVLLNFVSWVQSYFRKSADRVWGSLLGQEGQEAAETKDDLLSELDGLIGLHEMKAEVHKIVKNMEQDPAAATARAYHMFFLGNPGTGKTEVARIIARLFWAMELRTSKKVVEIKIHDILSPYNEGETLQRMKDMVQQAMGGVLFIDEAYLFAESEWGRKAFSVLLTEMENNRTNLTVILAGYEERLQKLMDVNPGIASRIPIRIHFEDYSPEEKLAIFKYHLAKSPGTRHVLDPAAEAKLLRVLGGCGDNGRGVRNVLENTLANVRSAELILESHVVDPHELHPEKVEEVLREIDGHFIGMAGLKTQLRQYAADVRYQLDRCRRLNLKRRRGHVYRLRFTGPPGTGKTSLARYMGRLFHAMGVCETSECVECGATTLKGAYVGHAQMAVNNLFHENRGKVIFIDEIYSLYNKSANQDDSFSREAIDTLVRCLSADEYQGTVVIIAGYEKEVNEFLQANPGLASRFPTEIRFSNYSAAECVEIFKALAKDEAYELDPGCEERLCACFECLARNEDFGNARTVGEVFARVESRIVGRLAAKAESDLVETDYTHITPDDIPSSDAEN